MSERLNQIELKHKNLPDLTLGLESIDKLMETHIDHQNIEQVADQLTEAINILHITGRLTQVATKIYEYAKGVGVYQVATNEETKKLGTTLQVKICEGLISDQSALYERTQRTIKSLTTYIEGLRSILSKNKEQQRIDNFKNV